MKDMFINRAKVSLFSTSPNTNTSTNSNANTNSSTNSNANTNAITNSNGILK